MRLRNRIHPPRATIPAFNRWLSTEAASSHVSLYAHIGRFVETLPSDVCKHVGKGKKRKFDLSDKKTIMASLQLSLTSSPFAHSLANLLKTKDKKNSVAGPAWEKDFATMWERDFQNELNDLWNGSYDRMFELLDECFGTEQPTGRGGGSTDREEEDAGGMNSLTFTIYFFFLVSESVTVVLLVLQFPLSQHSLS